MTDKKIEEIKPKLGRPVTLKTNRVTISADEKTVEIMRDFGDGNVSAGIRKAAELIEKDKNGTKKK